MKQEMRYKIYLSGPLFSEAEISWAGIAKSFLEDRMANVQVVWPHEIPTPGASPEEIFQANLQALQDCDLLVAILDGPQVDDGTAWEIGYFYSLGRAILGIRTDFRRAGESEESRVNAMVECSCRAIAGSLDQLASELKRFL